MPKLKPAKTKGFSSIRKKFMKLSNNALQILEKRYLKKNTEGKVIEKPEDLFRRVANNIALADAKYLLNEETGQNQEYFEFVKTNEFKKLLDKNDKVKSKLKKTEESFYRLMEILHFFPI